MERLDFDYMRATESKRGPDIEIIGNFNSSYSYNEGDVLGRGGFGTVFKGIRKTKFDQQDIECAFKVFNLDPSDSKKTRERKKKSFSQEVITAS